MKDIIPKGFANPDLSIYSDNKPRWNTPDFRRAGYHNLHNINRYGLSLRSDRILRLSKSINSRIGDLPEVARLTSAESFSAMVVVRDQTILYEKYAADFAADRPHAMMSVTKILMNLIIGELSASGRIALQQKVAAYLPDIGSGYAQATIQQVLNMDLENDYNQDYRNPYASVFVQEAVAGWRLPPIAGTNQTQHNFLRGIRSADVRNRTGYANFKSANTDVLAMIAERVSEKPLRSWILEIVEASGIENALYMSTDRDGFPMVDGGASMTARDIARLGLLFVRRGVGVDGRRVGNSDFIEMTRKSPGPVMPPPKHWYRYSNQTMTNGGWIGHSGHGGQFVLADLDTGIVGVFLSVLENADAFNPENSVSITRMLENVATGFPD